MHLTFSVCTCRSNLSGPNRHNILELTLGCKEDVEELAIRTHQFSSGLIELYEAWHCRNGTKFLESIVVDGFFELHPEILIRCYSRPLDGTNNSHWKQKTFSYEYPLSDCVCQAVAVFINL
ncbi:hypothetical protein AVEN_191681-1 [Araneus ventricosus]|uniref:Uncharacterized protein n=1 Tax=Araneus ventricosus TaxID=182803 RepID=A0A4Y2S5H8_ARAVE|nr:hypothetical protein AVEN_191681-1 [Araneus ventricosus]